MLGLPDEGRLIGHGVSTCATCDGFFFRDHEIAVVGGGDSAIEEAMFLTKFASKVTLIVRRDQLRASKIMQERAFANDKIEIRWNTVVTDDRRRHQARAHRGRRTSSPARPSDLPVTGLFVAIGHKPEHRPRQGPARAGGQRLPGHRPLGRRLHHQRRGRLRLRRRPGPHLPAGHHRRRLGLPGRHRRRALARGQHALSDTCTRSTGECRRRPALEQPNDTGPTGPRGTEEPCPPP